ncbi:MAG TPA: ECF-type sigma factor [Thermoanaerobaculia bacterium]|nr:ECF-type sigma factor [Thermoanaerobaculia bacterium]
MTHPEIAEVLGLSRATVERRWSYARIWLRRELSQQSGTRRT